MKKKLMLAACIGLLSAVSAVPAYAGVWKTGDGENTGRWWYDNEDGTWAAAQWKWIDGNHDGTAECYFFDESGWLASNTVTPDGYTVNADGAWTVDGIVQTKKVQTARSSSSDDESWEDFQNGDDEDEKSSKKKSTSKPDVGSSDSSQSTSPQGPALEADSSSSGDEKPVSEYPKETPDSSYRQSKAE